MNITIGYTYPDRAADYLPMDDGYRPDARQLEIDVELDYSPSTDTDVLEMVFEATNSPAPFNLLDPRDQIRRAIEEHFMTNAELPHHYSLSVGDTVTLRHRKYACEPAGWRFISHT